MPLAQAREARIEISCQDSHAIISPAPRVSQWAPRCCVTHIDPRRSRLIARAARLIRTASRSTGARDRGRTTDGIPRSVKKKKKPIGSTDADGRRPAMAKVERSPPQSPVYRIYEAE